ncbi:putative sterile alpha motif containing protein [Lyophyllum shimeji]|uniref:Sterile alpha motif containing protein n=1 Tax=Lyophyllum shimeji TaxID=47721 RepID=A0A9P3PF41_LYOSH|nr:putative sterile alpha motif containing protein [Lyophyllum shimeji]
MPEYVYALHDFIPEHEDEVEFHAGERIEIIEKDDLYGDGWWQGRNLAGKVGLFPQSYTAPVPAADSIAPSSSTSSSTTEPATTDASPKAALQALAEESDSEAPTTNNVPSSTPQTPTVFQHDPVVTHQRTASGEVMKATMTDVQQALEQLGRGQGQNADGDEARSFSFASSRGDNTEGETDTDFDMSDMDGHEGGAGESWHKGARTKLAEKARRAVEEAEKLEAMMAGAGSERRAVAPPIEVELSDESEGEEEYTTHSSSFPRAHPHIPEEDEDVETDQDRTPEHAKKPSSEHNTLKRSSSSAHSAHLVLSERDDTETQTATATRTTFPVFLEASPAAPSSDIQNDQPFEQPEAQVVAIPDPKRNSNNAVYRESLIALPSPTGSFPGMSGGLPLPTEQPTSKHSSIGSVSSTRPAASAMSQPPVTASSMQSTVVEDPPKKEKTHPSEWSVEDVVDWLKSKGFDIDVCEKFTEQEITGDVLLELDVNLLKTEIGIMAFGKRMRIANAIADLRRPPSIVYSDHAAEHRSLSLGPQPHSPLSPSHSQSHSHQSSHSRHQSLSQSHHSYPGSVTGVALAHPYAQASPSINSPMVYTTAGTTYAGVAGPDGSGMEYLSAQDRSPMMMQEPEGLGTSVSAPVMNGTGSKGRPAHLMLSPSDGALKESAKAVSDVPEVEEEEDRGVASDGEAVQNKSMRRRIFGRSHDSSISKASSTNSRHSKDGSITAPSTIAEKDNSREKDKDKDKDSSSTRHGRSKKSVDGGKGGERLSIFGGTFPGTLGKNRKPPPRYSAASEEPTTDRSSMFSRLHSSSSRKTSSSSQRPVTPNTNGTPKHSFKEPKNKTTSPVVVAKETRDPALLRKRTSSAPAPPTDASRNGASALNGAGAAPTGTTNPIKQGRNILEQIGESDHSGWMRKKGDRYNSWKLRYFVLKGQHMYCLRSNSPSETKIKGYINIVGYKVTVDENVNPGRYGFRIEHDNDKTHYFSSEEKIVIRDWMKAIMKATIGRDYTKPVISSCNIPTIPLTVAQAMNPAPRPPSPTARDATQRALRRENTNQLSTRDARILMGLPSATNDSKEERTRLESFFSNEIVAPNGQGLNGSANTTPKAAPARPSREMRRMSASSRTQPVVNSPEDNALIEWANSHLPMSLQIRDPTGSLCGGLALLRIAESIKGRPTSPPVPDSAFPQNPTDDKLDGLFQLFDFLLDNDVKMGSVSINDVRQGKRDKILQLLKALKAWEDKRRAIAHSISSATSVHAGAMMAPLGMANW